MIGLEMGETIASAIRIRSSESLKSMLFPCRAPQVDIFIYENGIVAVLGDEDQVISRGVAANELPPAGQIGARVK